MGETDVLMPEKVRTCKKKLFLLTLQQKPGQMSKFIYNFEVEARKSVNYSFKVCSCLLEGSISQLV